MATHIPGEMNLQPGARSSWDSRSEETAAGSWLTVVQSIETAASVCLLQKVSLLFSHRLSVVFLWGSLPPWSFSPRLASSRWDYCISVMLHQAVYKSQGRLRGGITVVAAEGVTSPNRCQWKKREASRTRQGAPFLTTCWVYVCDPQPRYLKRRRRATKNIIMSHFACGTRACYPKSNTGTTALYKKRLITVSQSSRQDISWN